MSELRKHAERELALLGGADCEMQQAIVASVLAMVDLFASQGHSGTSGAYAISCLEKVLRFEPITPLTGADDEWREISPGDEQNIRCSRVFRRGGFAYDSRGKVFREPSGTCYTSRHSHVPVTFPYRPTTEYVDVPA